jgi:hypothetical protein
MSWSAAQRAASAACTDWSLMKAKSRNSKVAIPGVT